MDDQQKSEEKALPTPVTKKKIKPIRLNLGETDKTKRIIQSVKRNLNIKISDLKKLFAQYLDEHAEEMSKSIVSIAPFDDYGKLLDEPHQIARFLRGDASSPENWKLHDIKSTSNTERALVEFQFKSIAADQGDCLTGFVYVGKGGEILHCFVHGR